MAQAIYAEHDAREWPSSAGEYVREICRKQARAAWNAMRQPTEEMRRAAFPDTPHASLEALRVWLAMHDAVPNSNSLPGPPGIGAALRTQSNVPAESHVGRADSEEWPQIRIVIHFADGQSLDNTIDAEEGTYNLRVRPDCPAVTNVWVASPGSKVELMSESPE
jgi:hypothetical protein